MLSLSPRTKSILLLLATLLLGTALGAVGNAWWAADRLDRIRDLRRPGGMERVLLQTINPTSPEQRAQVQAVLDRHTRRIAALRREHRRQMRTVADSLRADLRPLLTDAQMDRLNNRMRGPRGR